MAQSPASTTYKYHLEFQQLRRGVATTLPSLEQPWVLLPCRDSKVVPFTESFQEEHQPQLKGEGVLQGERRTGSVAVGQRGHEQKIKAFFFLTLSEKGTSRIALLLECHSPEPGEGERVGC